MNKALRLIILSLSGLIITFSSCRNDNTPRLVLLGTTDIHGTFFPFDFINNDTARYSLASVSTYVKEVRNQGLKTLLLDNGDILQGQPEVYYYNFIDTLSPHLCAEILNFMEYDAATAGNHDIEAGHPVYDRMVKDYNFPLMAANAVSEATGEPYFKPYVIVSRGGYKIAVMGLITPSVPNWLPPVLYSGIRFTNMTDAAAIWMEEIKKHKPDIIVGLFHSGWNYDAEAPEPGNSSDAVVYNVPGFDVVFTGHDHNRMNSIAVNRAGDTVVVINAGSRASNIARVDVFGRRGNLRFKGTLVETAEYGPDPDFMDRFSQQYEAVKNFVSGEIGEAPAVISSRDALFGPSGFTSMIHTVQLDITGADISFAAPLSFDVSIGPGKVTVADMFKLYRYENMLYTMSMTGGEIDGFLEHSVEGWFNTYTEDDPFMLNYRRGEDGKPLIVNGRARVSQPVYNFDSAAGIDYTVDVTRQPGNRVDISVFSDGRPFYADTLYTVAINSYRGSGGGGHIREGAGLSSEEALERIIESTERDLRYYMIQWIKDKRLLIPAEFNNWRTVPENITSKAKTYEWSIVYGSN